MTVLIPAAALLLALFAGYVAVHARTAYALRYVLIAAATAFGIGFFFAFPQLLGRPAPRYPTGDFHMIAMLEEPGGQVQMWAATVQGTRLYRFAAGPSLRDQLRGMTDGRGHGIYALTGRFVSRSAFDPRGVGASLEVRKPDLTRLPRKDLR